MRPRVVVSAVNVVEMGPLSVARDALAALAAVYGDTHEIVALVHRKALFDVPDVLYCEFPQIKRSWLRRLKFEYHDLHRISRGLHADLWLSLHDTTPKVTAGKQAVYCHTPAPFYPFHWKDLFRDWRFALFTLGYGWLYRMQIHRNAYVIVQQEWMRDAFREKYGARNVVVAHPDVLPRRRAMKSLPSERPCHFFYPSFPRVFKNMEIVLAAARIVSRKVPGRFTLSLTFSGSENRYAASLVKRYRDVREVRFLGLLSRDAVFARYEETDCLVFPSKLETWGLPITEFKPYARPMLMADLPYAHETVGDHRAAAFFDPNNPAQLADLMEVVIEGRFGERPVRAASIAPPYCRSWTELFELLLSPVTM